MGFIHELSLDSCHLFLDLCNFCSEWFFTWAAPEPFLGLIQLLHWVETGLRPLLYWNVWYLHHFHVKVSTNLGHPWVHASLMLSFTSAQI
jgi:hypothetical protein